MPDGHESWHVEGIAQGLAPSLNAGLAAPLAGLAGDGATPASAATAFLRKRPISGISVMIAAAAPQSVPPLT